MRAACWPKERRPKSAAARTPSRAKRPPWKTHLLPSSTSRAATRRPIHMSDSIPLEDHGHDRLTAKLRRIAALVRKESRQVIRDPSSVAIGLVLPLILILLFGYGLSLDVKDVPIAIVLEDASPTSMELAAGVRLSPYFLVKFTPSMTLAQQLMFAR